MKTQEAILTRRSTRRFRDKEVDSALLEKIIEAGRYAPSGGNSQTGRFFVITDKEVLNQLKDITLNAFSGMEIYEGIYPSLKASITLSKRGNYVFYYNAPCLIVVANRKDYGNSIADTAVAIENMMILANEFDLGSCWVNQLKWLNENEEILRLFEKYGLKQDERIYGSMVLGYPDTADGLPERRQIERKGNEVIYI